MPVKLVNGRDAEGSYWKKKGPGYPKYHYPANSCGLGAAAKKRAMNSKKLSSAALKARNLRNKENRMRKLIQREQLYNVYSQLGAEGLL